MEALAKKITTVFFDHGGTLFDYYPSNSEIWAKIAKRLGTKITPDDPRIQQGIRKQTHEFEKLNKPFLELSEAEIHTLNCHVLTAMGIDGENTMETINAEFLAREQGSMFTLYPDVPEILKKIKAKQIKIGLISNIEKRLVAKRRTSLEESGIVHYFDAIILSAEVGVRKPQKEIFDIALREIGTNDPAKAMHVGDSPVMDVRGAQNAGLIPILFDPLDLFSTENVIKIRTLSAILQYLE
ncbi:MAG: HAD family hydrolase [Candidatus Thorarchaeota archaeon]